MKKTLLLFAFLGSSLILSSQAKPWYVIQVNGGVTIHGNGMQIGDSIYSSDLHEVKLLDETAAITVCHPDSGVLRYDHKAYESLASEAEPGKASDLVLALLGFKNDHHHLKSRGDCECLNPWDCLEPDPAISEWMLLVNPIEFSSNTIGRGSFFVQFNKNGEVFNRILDQEGETVSLSKDLFLLDDSTYYDFEAPALLAFILEADSKATPQVICPLKLNILSEEEIEDYLSMNRRLMSHLTEDRQKEELIYSLYISCGKPNPCDVENWLK